MDEWIHPVLKVPTDHVTNSVDDAARRAKEHAESPQTYDVTDVSAFEKAIESFESSLS